MVAGRQGRTDDALAILDEARALLPEPRPPVLDYTAADALARVWRWTEAAAFAERAAEKAPQNTAVWVMLARARGSAHDDRGALEAAKRGLELAPRDPDLLRSQAAALRALDPTLADAALAAYERFRAEAGHTHAMRPVTTAPP
jgi:predicted Zn-dependent protease